MRWTGASLVAALVVFGAISADAQTRTGHARTAAMTISVTVVRSDGGPAAIPRPDSEGGSFAPASEAAAAPSPTANPSTQPVAARPRQSESAIAVVGSSADASTATRVFTINF